MWGKNVYSKPKVDLHKLRESKSIRLCPVLTFVASYFDNNGCVLSYFQRTVNMYCYKQHNDYSYPSFISLVLSLEKMY